MPLIFSNSSATLVSLSHGGWFQSGGGITAKWTDPETRGEMRLVVKGEGGGRQDTGTVRKKQRGSAHDLNSSEKGWSFRKIHG